jgi:hypothetical protein
MRQSVEEEFDLKVRALAEVRERDLNRRNGQDHRSLTDVIVALLPPQAGIKYIASAFRTKCVYRNGIHDCKLEPSTDVSITPVDAFSPPNPSSTAVIKSCNITSNQTSAVSTAGQPHLEVRHRDSTVVTVKSLPR